LGSLAKVRAEVWWCSTYKGEKEKRGKGTEQMKAHEGERKARIYVDEKSKK
jgi:hypothetical protein